MSDIVRISPVDSREVARRAPASDAQLNAALAAANDDIVPEIAAQMGRPVRYGGKLRSLKERVGVG